VKRKAWQDGRAAAAEGRQFTPNALLLAMIIGNGKTHQLLKWLAQFADPE
jgi:hypothetical protein